MDPLDRCSSSVGTGLASSSTRNDELSKQVIHYMSNLDGSLVSDRQHKLRVCEEHFSQLLNRSPAAISEELQQAATRAVEDPAISSAPPNVAEVAAALNKLKYGKAPGICNLYPPPNLIHRPDSPAP